MSRFRHALNRASLPSFASRLPGVCGATLLLLMGSANAFAAPLAVLSDVVGQVQVVHGTKTLNGKSGTALDGGDVVRVVSGSATIFYASRAPQVVKAGNQATIGAATTTSPQSSAWKGLYTGISSGLARRSQTKAFAVRGKDTTACPLVPAGLIVNPHPTLVWVAPKVAAELGVQSYEIYLFGPKGKLMWRTTSEKTFVVYPNDAPALQPQTEYVWQVTPRRLMKTSKGTPQLRLDDENKSVGLWFRLAKSG